MKGRTRGWCLGGESVPVRKEVWRWPVVVTAKRECKHTAHLVAKAATTCAGASGNTQISRGHLKLTLMSFTHPTCIS